MDKIFSDIKNGNTARSYLFFGEDAYKRRIYKDALKNALFSNEMNYSYFEGASINWQRVYDDASSVPFFAGKRLVIVENSGIFRAKGSSLSKEAEEEISELIKSIPETSCLAFFEEEAAKNKKIYKVIAKEGIVCECGKDSEKEVAAWLMKGFSQADKKISPDLVYYLIERTGSDHDRLKKEFDKLIDYTADSDTVAKDDIDAVTGQSVDAKVYEIVNACAQKNARLMLEKYYALLKNDVYPLIILASLRSQLELMLMTGELSGKGYSDAEIAKKTGKAEFIIRNNKKLLRNYSLKTIEGFIEQITLTDKKIKDGDMNERTGVELVLIKIAENG